MNSSARDLVVMTFAIVSFASFARAQAPTSANQTGAPNPSGNTQADANVQSQPANAAVQSGIDRPALIVAADKDEVTTKIMLRGLDSSQILQDDLEAGLLNIASQPSLLIRPSVTLVGNPVVQGKDFLTTLTVSGLAPFGDSTAPLLFKGKQVELLRFSKPGLLAKPPVGDAFIVRENDTNTPSIPPAILLVLENPSAFAYSSIRARLRFDNQDVCLFTAEKFLQTHNSASKNPSCNTSDDWTEFDVPQYAQVSLRANPSSSWFRDPASGYAKSAKRKGWLTLRFKGANPLQIQEQNIPLEVQFEPGSNSIFLSLLWVALWLSLGAALSLFLRVTVPNMKRKNDLKDQLNSAGKRISTISSEVDSNLRVLLRVERRSLDELRVAVWPFGPGYADYAARVEQGIPTLNRRIAAVLRLDTALVRKKTMSEQSAAPTRLEQIEDMLSAVSEALKQDELSEEDWVFVNQHLENAEKLLREPTQTEKEAFEAMLAGRWKAIRTHFGDANGVLQVPPALKDLKNCFPDPSLLPKGDDQGFSQWLDAVGIVRADLQLSALALVWDFQFLVPANVPVSDPLPEPWGSSAAKLNRLLSTPAIDNLREAKRLLRQLAEGVSEADITNALRSGGAFLVMDPSVPRPDRTIRFSVRFRQENLNTAAAKQLITCNWTFDDTFLPRIPWVRRSLLERWLKPSTEGQPTKPRMHLALPENGWFVHHYFEKLVYESVVSVAFFDSQGKPIQLVAGENWPGMVVHPRPDKRGNENWQRFILEVTQVGAALLVPLATLASNTINGGTTSFWWEIVALGFGSDTIKNIIVGKDISSNAGK